jgi:hypothetical protein
LTLICSLPKVKRPAIWDTRSASYGEGAKDNVSLHTICRVPASSSARDPPTINAHSSSSLISCAVTEEEGKRYVKQNKKKIT